MSVDRPRHTRKIDGRTEPEIVASASPWGNVTRAALLGLGLSKSEIDWRVAAGRLFPSWSGVYGVGRPARSKIERADAAVLACGRGAALFAPSAMTLWEFWRRWVEPFEVVAPVKRRPNGLIVHQSQFLGPAEVTTHRGIRVTKPARTMFDMASRWDDDQLKRYVNRALTSHYLKRGHLEEQIMRHPSHPAAKRLKWFVQVEGGPTRSDWERALPAWCTTYDLPIPIFGVMLAGYEADAVYLEEQVVLELDSWEYHQGRVAFEHDRDLDVDRLDLEFETVRITWERIFGRPAREAQRLGRILERRRRRAA